jgi:hypothetical protein
MDMSERSPYRHDRTMQARRVASRLLDRNKTIREVLIDQLGDSFDCTRDWNAWSVGTMRDSDFVPVADRIDSIVEAIRVKLEGV